MASTTRLPIIAEGKLTAQPLEAVPQFNWVFLVELIVCGILTLFFLFYFNRLFATLLSYGLRAYTWHYYRIYIDIHALQVSLLGGRIFFKGVRYHGENETVLVQSGYVTWRYWLRSVQGSRLTQERSRQNTPSLNSKRRGGKCKESNTSENDGTGNVTLLPCRMEIKLHGVEWFVYNRSAAYDAILSGFHDSVRAGSMGAENEDGRRAGTASREANIVAPDSFRETGAGSQVTDRKARMNCERSSASQSESVPDTGRPALPTFISLLPIWVSCHKGALIVGNQYTKSILTFTFGKCAGKIDAASSGPLDLYKQCFEFELFHPLVQMKPNPDFKQSQLSALNTATGGRRTHHFNWTRSHRKQKIWHKLRDLIPYYQRSVESFRKGTNRPKSARPMPEDLTSEPHWLGLTRYLDEESRNEHEGWNAIEYGRFSTLLDCPAITLKYHWDIPGTVSGQQNHPGSSDRRMANDINGAVPPEWGMHLIVKGGMINYGPWADRERVNLQAMLFPNFYRDSRAASHLNIGESRQSSSFNFLVDFENETNIRVPTREASKDWKWKNRSQATNGASRLKKTKEKSHPQGNDTDKGAHGPDIRPFGWIALQVGHGSRIEYQMDMFATSSGYRNTLLLEFQSAKMTTSVNHAILWQATYHKISCDLSNPLEWNTMRTWSFDIDSPDLDLFVLREHIFLFTDLVNDWTSGPFSEFYTFLPFQYNIRLSAANAKLFLNVNDSNIINDPTDTDDNSFLIFKSETLISNVCIPTVNYRPKQNSIPFDLNLSHTTVELSAPLWNTHRSFIQQSSIASLDNLVMTGNYSFNTLSSSTLTDVLTLDIFGASASLYMYGFLVNDLLKLKENYFGEHVHFKTLEEYQDLANSDSKANPTITSTNSNDLDVIIHIRGNSYKVLFPGNVYDTLNCVAFKAATLETDVRFTNYYMDLQASFSPLTASLEMLNPSASVSEPDLFIDGLNIYGHRLFGLPPAEPTYVCNWDFDVGRIVGQFSSNFLKNIISALRSFAYSIDDEENSLPPLYPFVLHDIIFLRARITSIEVWVVLDAAALLFSSGTVDIDLNDWIGRAFSMRLNLTIPDITAAVIDQNSATKQDTRPTHPVKTYSIFETSIKLKVVERKADISTKLALQQHHIRVHDQRTQRTPWLVREAEEQVGSPLNISEGHRMAAMPVPRMPPPIQDNLTSSRSSLSSMSVGPNKCNLPKYENVSKEENNTTRQVRSSFLGSNSTGIDSDARSNRPASQMSSTDAYHAISKDNTGKILVSNSSNLTLWSMPHFPLHRVALDRGDLPSPTPLVVHDRDEKFENDTPDLILSGNDIKTNHLFFSVGFVSGIHGFCRPEALFAVTSLLESIQPIHPIEVLDDLQAAVVSDILTYTKRLTSPKESMNLGLTLPICRIRLINTFPQPEGQGMDMSRDQFDLKASGMRVVFSRRTKTEKDYVKPKQEGLTVHFTAKSISLAVVVKGLFNDPWEHMILSFQTEEFLFWLMIEKAISARIQIQDINLLFPSENIKCLASFFQRLDAFTSSISNSMATITHRRRLHTLIYHLTKFGSRTPDPQFLTRPSYVLRAAEEHLRVHDSWKILSRLRNIYKCLPQEQLQQLTSKCIDNNFSYPADCESVVLSNFDQWRTWDLAHVKKSHVMNMIWGPSKIKPVTDKMLQNISVFVRSSQLFLHPPPNEALLLLEDLSTQIQVTFDTQQGILPTKGLLTVENRCSNAILKLRWELIKIFEENLDNFMSIFLQPNSCDAPSNIPNKKKETKDFHVLIVVDKASAILDSINLTASYLGEGLKSSIVFTQTSVNQQEKLSILFGSETAFAELRSRTTRLMLWRLFNSHAFLSHSFTKVDSHEIHEWKCHAKCRSLQYDMIEDPLGLIQVADRFLEDEVKGILGIVTNLDAKSKSKERIAKPDVHRFYMTAFLDDYELRFLLLPSITYWMSGGVVRLSLSPKTTSSFQIDFDIKNNTHTLQSNKEGRERIISSLAIPPINGRLVKFTSNSRSAFDIYSTIELIKVDADSVRNILGTIRGPEISHFTSDLQHDIKILKRNIDDLLRQPDPAPVDFSPTEPTPIYRLQLTLAGLSIHSSAPSLGSKNSFADMDLNFGVVQINVENTNIDGSLLDLPQLEVILSQMIFDVRKREKDQTQSFGKLKLCAKLSGTSSKNDRGETLRYYHLSSRCFHVDLSAETASVILDIATHLQERFKMLDVSEEIKQLRKLRRIRSRAKVQGSLVPAISVDGPSEGLFNTIFSVDLLNIQLSWLVSACTEIPQGKETEDLVFSIQRIEIVTGRQSAARLRIEGMQLQMVHMSKDKRKRSQNSALLPEVVFDVAYLSLGNQGRLAFQAAGKVLDIRMTSDFILPASILQRSLASASERVREAKSRWNIGVPSEKKPKSRGSGIGQLSSLLVDADFAGAEVSLQSRDGHRIEGHIDPSNSNVPQSGAKYGQYFASDAASIATFRAPGVAVKVQFEDAEGKDPTLNAEIKVAASTNVLHPTVVPLITEITSSITEVVGESGNETTGTLDAPVSEKGAQAKSIEANDPTTILGRCKLNIGLRICKQEFTLSCQPIARVAASARFEDSYITINTVQSEEQRRFFAILMSFNKLQASIKHVYSSESTANFDIDSIVVSMMNSKHVSSSNGISAILKVNPVGLRINAKQVQDFLLFQEIWAPHKRPSKPQKTKPSPTEAQPYIVQQYQQMASAESFPWNSTISIEQLDVQLDLGQTLGKSEFSIKKLWLSSKKSSDWEQNLCIGFDAINVQSSGRLSGFVKLSQFKIRTSIEWIDHGSNLEYHTPLIQAAIGFNQLQSKISFEYQPFLVADITSFEFLMYNVRDTVELHNDRLVSTLDGGKFQLFCTTLTASQGLGLFQTLRRLVQDKQAAYESSIKEIEAFIQRKSSVGSSPLDVQPELAAVTNESNEAKMPISLQTNVVVNLQEIKVGAFPNTFQDNQIFKLEALDAEARFSVVIQAGKIHSGLGLTLGQLRVALSNVSRPTEIVLEELSATDIAHRAAGSRGGTILKVPRLVAIMETWQVPASNHIDYIFKSFFEGKVDVGWNYSRIAFIRGMWDTHSRALANRLGKPLPQAAVQITGEPKGEDGKYSGQEKITAVVNVPQSKYTYTALEPPVIETPQLRDMGEATPPLEWIGLHRDKLPNITHQIIIVTLMEVAKDVEDAYSKILGS
ncbi:Macrophage colony-stimulating factor 1 receptor [Ophidiomyces ophidiicola]|nr:Macrophage colony-stimulating factor 1 receptor [Ophidiomyces ophidiicola]